MSKEKEIILTKLLMSILAQLKCLKMAIETSNLLLVRNEGHVSIVRTYEDKIKEQDEILLDLIKSLEDFDDDK